VITDAAGIPLAVQTGPANQRDEQRVLPLLDAIPPLPGPRGGRPRRKPKVLQGDRGYGFPWVIAAVRRRGIRPLLAPRGSEHGSGLGKTRYVVEQAQSWLGNFRRLKLCYERTGEHFQAFHVLAACVICANKLAARHRSADSG
jgi:transposase